MAMDSTERKMALGCGILIFLGILAVSCGSTLMYVATEKTVEIKIHEKHRIASGDTSYWMVMAEDRDGTPIELTNTDMIWYWKWDSSTIQNELKVGGWYRVRIAGIRLNFLSWYPDIVKIEEKLPADNSQEPQEDEEISTLRERLRDWARKNENHPENGEIAKDILKNLPH